MNDAAPASHSSSSVYAEAFLPQYLHQVCVRVPRMEEQRQAVLLRKSQLHPCKLRPGQLLLKPAESLTEVLLLRFNRGKVKPVIISQGVSFLPS